MTVQNWQGPTWASIILLGAVSLSGCANKRGGPLPYDVTLAPPDSPVTAAALGAGYKIAPMDTLTVRV
ncbi:MAG TPA: hypothetical protein VNA29_08740, partial [Sphingomicrobium sp.]|nr:hypothetical protein [Sphingomicrobium sp.]